MHYLPPHHLLSTFKQTIPSRTLSVEVGTEVLASWPLGNPPMQVTGCANRLSGFDYQHGLAEIAAIWGLSREPSDEELGGAADGGGWTRMLASSLHSHPRGGHPKHASTIQTQLD